MNEKAMFRVEHPNGYIEVVVGEFFGTSNKKEIGKLLRMAKTYCSEKQRKALHDALLDERLICRRVLNEMDAMRAKLQTLLSDNFGGVIYYGTDRTNAAERAISRREAKLTWSADKVAAARWDE